MKKRGVKRDEAYENFVNEMQEMTDEEFDEKTQSFARALRFHLSDKDRKRAGKRLLNGLKYIKNYGVKNAAKEKKTARLAKALAKRMIEEARKASKLAY